MSYIFSGFAKPGKYKKCCIYAQGQNKLRNKQKKDSTLLLSFVVVTANENEKSYLVHMCVCVCEYVQCERLKN